MNLYFECRRPVLPWGAHFIDQSLQGTFLLLCLRSPALPPLWRRAPAPLGIELFREVMLRIEAGELPNVEQEPWTATWEPALKD